MVNPTKANYTFAGWYDNINGIGTPLTKVSNNTLGDITLYAKWTKNSYTLSYTLIHYDTEYAITGISGTASNIVIPKLYNGKPVTQIYSYAFANNSMTSVTFESGSQLWYIGVGAFSGCSNLSYIALPGNVSNIDAYAFSGCSSLGYITIPSSVNDIGTAAFSNCKYLTSITMPKSVVNLGAWAFENCTALTGIIFENNSLLSSIGNRAFEGCTSLIGINFTGYNLASIGTAAFLNCTKLKSITIPSSVTYVGAWAFENCFSLTIYAEVPGKPAGWEATWNYSNRPVVWGGLTYTLIHNNTEYAITGINGTASNIVIPKMYNGKLVTQIYSYAFANNSMTSVTFESGSQLWYIGVGAFSGCGNLSYISLPGNVSNIDAYAFKDCSSLGYIEIPYSVNYIGAYAFYGSAAYVYCYGESYRPSELGWHPYWDAGVYVEWEFW